MPIFRVKSVKIYTGQKNLHWRRQRQLSGMIDQDDKLDNGDDDVQLVAVAALTKEDNEGHPAIR